MKVGLIRCLQTEDRCSGTRDFKAMRQKKGAFAKVEGDIEIIGFSTCGGCPGKKAAARAAGMIKRGADTIVLASCITKGHPSACPYAEQMKEEVAKKIGSAVQLLDYSH